MYVCPRLSFSTFAGSVSNPVTRCPASANRKPKGSPTYPQPIIPTRSCAPLKYSGLRSVGIDVVRTPVEIQSHFSNADDYNNFPALRKPAAHPGVLAAKSRPNPAYGKSLAVLRNGAALLVTKQDQIGAPPDSELAEQV